MSGFIAQSPTGDWTYGAAILSFVFPELLFIFVAGALYVIYTMPHIVPGHRYQVQPPLRSVMATPAPGTSAQATPPAPPAAGGPAAGDTEG